MITNPDPLLYVSQCLPLDIFISYRPEEGVPKWVDKWYNYRKFKLLKKRYPTVDPSLFHFNKLKVFWGFVFHNNIPTCIEWDDGRVQVDFLRNWASNPDFYWILRYKPFFDCGMDSIPAIESDIGYYYVNNKSIKQETNQVIRLIQLFNYFKCTKNLPSQYFPSLYVSDLLLSDAFVLMNLSDIEYTRGIENKSFQEAPHDKSEI